jgi:hypothetical protein
MATRKKSAAKVTVQFDAKTALRFEQLLRNGLVESSAVDREDNLKLRLTESSPVEIDPVAAARISEELREVLFNSGIISAADKNTLDSLTKGVK